MTSYVQKKSRVFREAGEPEPLLPKRSEGRLKRYPSATDARAWTVENEDRRQHILEMLLQKAGGLSLGRYIPLEVLINTLLANKDADIERLRKQLEDLQKLLDAYESLDLTPEQRRQINKVKESLGLASERLSGASSSKRSDLSSRGLDDSGPESCAANDSIEPPCVMEEASLPTESVSQKSSLTKPGVSFSEKPSYVSPYDSLMQDGIPPPPRDYNWDQMTPEDMKQLILQRDRENDALRNFLEGRLNEDTNKEISAIEDEIEELRRKGLLTPEKEIELLRKEIDALKRCCSKVQVLQADNEAMRKELGLGEGEGTLEEIRKKAKDADDLLKKNQDLEKQLSASKSKNLDEMTTSKIEVASVRKQMECRCKEIDALRSENIVLRKKINEFEARDQETERLRYRVKESEVLRIERDRMKMRVDELANIEMQYMDLLNKTQGFDAIKSERDMFKAKYEELVCVECEAEMLRQELDASRSILEERNALERQVCDLECCLADQENEINRLVDHIENLAQGRDDQQSLEFEELEYIHSRICDATARLLNKKGGGSEVQPSETDKYLLMKRNMSLEQAMAGKQQQAQNTVTQLEMDIQMERQRLEDLRKHLENEKRNNNELLRRLKMQTKTMANLQMERELMKKKGNIHEENLQRYLNAVEQEKSRCQQLEAELEGERSMVQRLKEILSVEREASRSAKRRDPEQLERMRQELERAMTSDVRVRTKQDQSTSQFKPRPCPSSCPNVKRNVRSAPVPPNNTTFYTELKGETNYPQRYSVTKREKPNKEYED